MKFEDILRKRQSIRKYSSKKPDWRDLMEAINAARFAPMAGNIFTPRFIIVSDETKIERLKNSCAQDFVQDAQYVVVMISDPSLPNKSFEGSSEIYCRQQAGASIQNFLLKLTELGLSTCWVGLFDEELVKNNLKIPEHMYVEAIFPIGYPFEKVRPKKKPDLENIISFNEYGKKKMKGSGKAFEPM